LIIDYATLPDWRTLFYVASWNALNVDIKIALPVGNERLFLVYVLIFFLDFQLN
jgi:hypothetical protein